MNHRHRCQKGQKSSFNRWGTSGLCAVAIATTPVNADAAFISGSKMLPLLRFLQLGEGREQQVSEHKTIAIKLVNSGKVSLLVSFSN